MNISHKIRISNARTDTLQTAPYFYVFFGLLCLTGLIVGIFKGELFIVFECSILLILLFMGFLITNKIYKYLKLGFIDANFLYISDIYRKHKIPLEKIQSVEYCGPMKISTERNIQIKYFNKNNEIEKILILPTALDESGKIKLNMNILGLINQKIKNQNII